MFAPDYAAPEVLQGRAYRGKEQDVWALGILLYTIVFKENPFYNIDEILDHPLRVPANPCSEACLELIRKMLDRDVDERITITEVQDHPWFAVDEEEEEEEEPTLQQSPSPPSPPPPPEQQQAN
jgi:protein-serine/threonine kinase